MARTNKKLSAKALRKAVWRHNCTLQWCWNYERMQATGFAYSMAPIMKELYDTDEEVCENLERHMQFYNSHPGASAVIAGASAALEESYETDMSDSIKVALMGPMAGIGDTIQAVLVKPIAFIIAAALAAEGSFLAVPIILIPFILLWAVRFPLFKWGYNRSVKVIEDIDGNSSFNKMRDAAQILGLVVVGGFAPGMVSISIPYTYNKVINEVSQEVKIQDTLDGILPFLLPICAIGLCYWLIKKKKISPVKVIGIMCVLGFVLGALGVIA